MTLLSVDTIETAWEKIASAARSWRLDTEHIDINTAAGRILAEDIFSEENIPGFRRSVVDGYAVVSADTAAAGDSIPVLLKLSGVVEIGMSAGCAVRRGECVYVPTGGMIPQGADAVVMLEWTEKAGENCIAVSESVAPGKGIAEADEDVRLGEIVVQKGTKLRAPEIGLLAAIGRQNVPVFCPLRLALFSTGNELINAAEKPSPGKIRNINSPALSALAAQRGYKLVTQKTIPDDPELLEKAIRGSLETADIVAVSGGSSQGDKDWSAEVFARIAEPGIFTKGLALKPGKPAIFGYDQATNTLLCGLPGHPVSAIIVFELFLSRLYRSLSFQRAPLTIPAFIDRNLASDAGKTCCQPVILHYNETACIAEPVFGKSGMISTLTRADGFFIIDQNREGLKKGETVQVLLF